MRPIFAVILMLALLSACGSTETRRLRHAASELMNADLTRLTHEEQVEAAWIAVLADPGREMAGVANAVPFEQAQGPDGLHTGAAYGKLALRRARDVVEAAWRFDARSFFADIQPTAPIFRTDGAVVNAVMKTLAREDMNARLEGAEQALVAAERWKGMAPGIAGRARRGEIVTRAALLTAMASAVDADVLALREARFDASPYGGHAVRRMNEIADKIALAGSEIWRHHAVIAGAAVAEQRRLAAEERARRAAERRRQQGLSPASGNVQTPVRASG